MPLVFGTGALTEVSVPLAALVAANVAQASSLATSAIANTAVATAQTTLASIEVARQTRDFALDIATAVQIALQIGQLVTYYNKFNDRIDDRDAKIDAQIAFMQTIDDNRFGIDVPMLNAKKGVITGLGIPGVDMCTDVIRYRTQYGGDGQAVITKSDQLADESCGGIPSGWGIHDGTLMAVKSASYAGGIIANSAKRQSEEMIDRKVPIVRSAHTSMRAVFRSGETLAKYAQASTIHSGLADIYLQGFNSAGAALGASIGRLSSAPTTGSQTGVGNSAGQSNTDVSGFA